MEAAMADAQLRGFTQRLKRIDRAHRRLARGYEPSVLHDGLIVPVPRRRRVRIPFAGLALILIAVLGFKGAAHALLGADTYESRIAALAEGGAVERAGAWIMQADALTLWLSAQLSQVLR
jgi:hypothetical protein